MTGATLADVSPRPRRHDRHLPPRLYHRHGAYWHVIGGRWTRLAADLATALRLWAEREGAGPRPPGETVGEAMDRYALEVIPTLAPATQDAYRRHLTRLRPVFGDAPLSQVRPTHIAAYLDRRSAKAAANLEMAVLANVYAYAMRWGWTDANPCRGVRRNPRRARDRYITDQELQALRAVAPPDVTAAVDLTLLTALRVGDLLGLRWSDMSAEGLTVRHEKTKARRLYQATPGLLEVLERIRRLRRRVGSVYLFARPDGQRYPRGDWGARWQRLKRRAGLAEADLHWHDLRARALTDAARAMGRDYAQALAGHASGDQTEAYVRARETVPVRPLR